MERESNQMPQNVLCRSGCGFYGNPATDSLCSKCYKDALKKKQSNPAPSMTGRNSPAASSVETISQASSAVISAITTASPTVTARPSEKLELDSLGGEGASCSASSSSADTSTNKVDNMDTGSTDSSDSSLKDQKKKKSRCFTCRKKVGLTGFECRCGGLFCSLHRYSDEHECKFDYKQLGAQEIRKNNPLIVGKKIQKI